MNIIQQLIPTSSKNTRPGIKMKPTYITIHETDNTSKGADDVAHANLQSKGNSRQASWHLQVDKDSCIQSIPFDEVAWHAGTKTGNYNSIGMEICVNADGDFKQAVTNAAEVTRQLMKQFNIPIDRVVQHNHWSGKHCPRHLRDGDWGINWADFISMLTEENPYKVVVPNTAFWQAKALVSEFEKRGFKCEGVARKSYRPGEKPSDKDPYQFVIKTDLENAKRLVAELQTKGYGKAYGEEIK